jgi:hypothetical protein
MIKVQKILSTLLNAVAFMLSNISITISQDSYTKKVSQIIGIGSDKNYALQNQYTITLRWEMHMLSPGIPKRTA